MPAEIRKALTEAISIAPVDPLGKGGGVTKQANREIGYWKIFKNSENFKNDYQNTLNMLEPDQKDALNLLLWAQAIALAKYALPETAQVDVTLKRRLEKDAGTIYLANLLNPEINSEEAAYDKTWHQVYPDRSTEYKQPKKRKKTVKELRETEENLQPLGEWLYQRLQRFEEFLADEPPEIRHYIDIRDETLEAAKSMGIKDPGLWDFIIGNLNLHKELEPEFSHVAEKMGLEGVKKERIIKRAAVYEEMLSRINFNYEGYQALGLGFRGLRDRHEKYLKRFGMDNYVHEEKLDGSFVSYAATEGIMRAYLVSRYTLQQEYKAVREESDPEDFNPRSLFLTPGFTTIPKMTENALGIKTVEFITQEKNHFFPTAEELKTFLAQKENDDVLIFNLAFINNPGSVIVPEKQFREVLEVVAKYRNSKGLKMIVVNDGAYLGMGDEEKIKRLGSILNEMISRRFDIIPMTKVFAQNALRAGDVSTPDKDLAAHIPAITKWLDPSISYAMMLRAMAIWDYVHYEDQLEFFRMLNVRQQKLIRALSARDDIFNLEKSFATREENGSLGAFYIFVPVHKNCDPLYLPVMTGLFGNLDATFFLSNDLERENYIRFAVGIEELSDEKIKKLERDLFRWKEVWKNIEILKKNNDSENLSGLEHQSAYSAYL